MAAIAVAPTAGAASAAPTKCKIVIKKIHGKKKKVRVCPKPKPKPKPKPPKKITIATRPNPVTVSPQVDESRSASATIDAAGGTVSASGPNGTSYTLSVPAGALFEDTAITLTPVASIAKLPLSGGLVAAVRLQPQGLTFAKLATLTIGLGKSVSVQRQIAFAAEDSGKDFHLYPKQSQPRTVTLKLAHFTLEGVGQGTMQDVGKAAQHPPSSWQAQAEQLQALLQKSREAGKNSPFKEGELEQKSAAILKQAYEQHVLPDLQAATTSSNIGSIEAAIREALQWMRTVQLLLGEDAFADEQAKLRDLFHPVLANLLKRVQERCGSAGRQLVYSDGTWWIDVETPKKIIGVVRQAQLLGFEGDPPLDDLARALQPCRPRGFRTEVTDEVDWPSSSGGAHWTVVTKLRVCTPDPDVAPWKSELVLNTVIAGSVFVQNYSGDVNFTAHTATIAEPAYPGSAHLTILTGPPPQMRVESTYVNGFGDQTSSVAVAPLLEDTSCPAVSS